MAQYNHKILVDYLRDVYSLELLYRKVDNELGSMKAEINHEKSIIFQFENAVMPVMKDPELSKIDDSSWFTFIVIGLIAISLFFIPVVGPILGIIGVLFEALLFCLEKNSHNLTNENRIKKSQAEFEQALSKYETLQWGYNKYHDTINSLIAKYNTELQHLNEIKSNITTAYGVNIIPNKYRDIYVAYYLYDYFSSSRETDLDKVLQTMLLDQIVERLDRIIDQQEEIILNQRMELALQEKQSAQLQENHRAQLQAIARVEQNQQLQSDYLAMIDTNTRITNFFVTADYINKYL